MSDFIFSFQIRRGTAVSNDRTVFNEEKIQKLAASIQRDGLIQPILVRPIPQYICPMCQMVQERPFYHTHDRKLAGLQVYELVAGERRWRAMTQVLQMEKLPVAWVQVKEMDDKTASDLMLMENLGREDLNPIDEGEGYQNRIDNFGYTAEGLAELTGFSIDRIRRRLNLLKLAPQIQDMVRKGTLDVVFAEKMTGLAINAQMAAIKLLSQTPNITVNTFERFRNQLLEEQSQVSLFSLVDFWADQVQNQKWAANGIDAEIDVPVSDTAPQVVIKGHDKTGDVIHRYILALMDSGEFSAVAPVVGKLYAELVKSRKIQVPAPRPVSSF